MFKEFYEKLAKLAVNYSLAIYAEVLKAGGHPLLGPPLEGKDELLYKYGSEEQLLYVDDVKKAIINEFDCYINIFGDYNRKKLSLVDPKLIAKVRGSPANKELMLTYMKRSANGELKWVVIPYPSHSFAQEANMDLFSYSEFVQKAIYLDKEDPVREWKEIERKQEKIVDYLNKVDKIQVLGENTDLHLSVNGRKWEKKPVFKL